MKTMKILIDLKDEDTDICREYEIPLFVKSVTLNILYNKEDCLTDLIYYSEIIQINEENLIYYNVGYYILQDIKCYIMHHKLDEVKKQIEENLLGFSNIL